MATEMRIDDVLRGTGGVRLKGPSRSFSAISTDSRAAGAGQLFWALVGPNFDGHDFVAAALARGAIGAVVEAGHDLESLARDLPSDVVLIAVDDTLRALGDLAAYWRRRCAPKVAAITGSNGKTTTKEMVARVLASLSPVLMTKGNLNNLIGLPLTLLELRDQPLAVLEMGMNAPGEIRRLAGIARPDVALITQVAAAHLEGLGTLDGVADAKWELFEELPPGATAILNLDDPKLVERRSRLPGHVVTFGVRGGDVHAEDVTDLGLDGVRFTAVVAAGVAGARAPAERVDVRLELLGLHNVSNALAAIAMGCALGVPASRAAVALASMTPVPGRMRPLSLGRDVVVLDDTYNANPGSMAAALSAGARAAGPRRRFAALGEMRELGVHSEASHREVGALVAREGYDLLVTLGEVAQGYVAGARAAGFPDAHIRAVAGDDAEAAATALLEGIAGPTLVVVKGSRGARMERVVEGLTRSLGHADGIQMKALHG